MLHLEGYRQEDFANFMGVTYPTYHKMLMTQEVVDDLMNMDGARLQKEYDTFVESRRTHPDASEGTFNDV